MAKQKYSLTPEHRAQLKPWANRWIANAMSTKAMDDEDRAAMRAAIKGLYEASNLEPPPPHRIVFVPSPLVGNIAAGFAAGIWWLRDNVATYVATRDATNDATYVATRDATDDATRDATYVATRVATNDATRDATRDATNDATRVATNDATYVATRDATDVATNDATYVATYVATNDATRDATYVATNDATDDATDVATRDATDDATYVATYVATYDATRDATRDATNVATRVATNDATDVATDVATRVATYVATRDATDDATYVATYVATNDATDDATRDATDDATRVATYVATRDATNVATYVATRDATDDATRDATYVATRDATNVATNDATNDATRDATDDATYVATYVATNDATRDATDDATNDATRDATDVATNDATYVATYDATNDATDVATDVATYVATDDATDDATRDATQPGWAVSIAVSFSRRHFSFFLNCAKSSWRMRNAGNHWSGWVAYLSFFHHVAKLDLPIYDKFRHYEAATIHGSWRWMHPKFCIVSDRPKTLKIDHLRRPHCEDGPSHEWRDGWRLYHWHGQQVEPHIIEKRFEITPAMIRAETNVEFRRVLTEIYAHIHGPGKIIEDMGARLLSEDTAQGRPRRMYEVDGARFIHVINGSLEPDGTRREFFLGASPDAKTPRDAIAASYGRPTRKYREAVRT